MRQHFAEQDDDEEELKRAEADAAANTPHFHYLSQAGVDPADSGKIRETLAECWRALSLNIHSGSSDKKKPHQHHPQMALTRRPLARRSTSETSTSHYNWSSDSVAGHCPIQDGRKSTMRLTEWSAERRMMAQNDHSPMHILLLGNETQMHKIPLKCVACSW